MRNASALAELLVVLSIVGLALCLFVPRTNADVTAYTLDIIIGVVTLGAMVGVCISAEAFWRRPLLVAGATVLCAMVGAVIGWTAIMHSLLFVVGLGAICVAFIVYLIIQSGRRAEQ